MPYIENFQEFAARHGPPLDNGTMILFADGASSSNGYFMPHEPPADPARRIEVRKAYHAEKLRRLEQGFKQLKAALLGLHDSAGPCMFRWVEHDFGPMPAQKDKYGQTDRPAMLRKLKALAAEQRAAIKLLDDEFEALPAIQAVRQREAAVEAAHREEQARQAALATELETIEL